MTTYAERTNRSPDFRVKYSLRQGFPIVRQHLRSDVQWAEDEDLTLVWMIWPEYESSEGVPLPEGEEAQLSGTATMWVLNEDSGYRSELSKRVRIGAKGYFWRGDRFADFEVVEVFWLNSEQ